MSNVKTSFLFTALFAACTANAANTQTVNVYTYDSFTSDWGAGPKIKGAFEQQFPQCVVNYVAFENTGTLFNRLRLDGKKTQADVVVGLDQYAINEAKKTGLFRPHNVDLAQLSLPMKWDNDTFLPYDFGEFAFIYDKNKLATPPQSLKELIERQDLKVIYQDPRTSSVGRGLLIWLNAIYPAEKVSQAWQTLAKHTVTVGKGWSDTYGAFLKGEADLVLSYSTSPLYHLLSEQKDHYAATQFSEGGVLQIETAAKINRGENHCADQFVEFLIHPSSQKTLVKRNVMLPVINQPIEPHYDALKAKQLKATLADTRQVNSQNLKKWIAVWQQALVQ